MKIIPFRNHGCGSLSFRAALAVLGAVAIAFETHAADGSAGAYGFTGIGSVPYGGPPGSEAYGISGDGSTVVGCRVYVSYVGGSYQVTQQAYSWNASQGMDFLGYLPGTLQMSCALDASGDGSTIVGWADSGSGYKAAIWDAAHGWRDLNQVLASAGVDLVGWDLTSAMAISNDGQIITGSGTDPNGNTEGWVVTLVPEPASLGFLSSLLALAVAWKRRCERR